MLKKFPDYPYCIHLPDPADLSQSCWIHDLEGKRGCVRLCSEQGQNENYSSQQFSACGCDEYRCNDFNDCCEDLVSFPGFTGECIQLYKTFDKNRNDFYVSVINKCPQHWMLKNIADKCVERPEGSDDISVVIPVGKQDRRENSNLLFKNVYCAICNGFDVFSSDARFWKFGYFADTQSLFSGRRAECKPNDDAFLKHKQWTVEEKSKYLLKRLHSGRGNAGEIFSNCVFSISIDYLADYYRPCFANVRTTKCATEAADKLCQGTMSLVTVNNTIYRNPDCAMCDGHKATDIEDTCPNFRPDVKFVKSLKNMNHVPILYYDFKDEILAKVSNLLPTTTGMTSSTTSMAETTTTLPFATTKIPTKETSTVTERVTTTTSEKETSSISSTTTGSVDTTATATATVSGEIATKKSCRVFCTSFFFFSFEVSMTVLVLLK